MTTTVTLDTNVVREYWSQRARVAVVEALINLAEGGLISLAVTRRIFHDIPDPPLAERISSLREIGVNLTGSVFRLDISALDSGDMLGSELALDVFESVACNLALEGQPAPDWRDWDHLHGHYLSGRDVFLTWDKDILRAAPQLDTQLGIVIMKPEDFIDSLSAQVFQ